MNKLVYSFSTSIICGILSAILAISIRIKIINSIFIGLLASDVIQLVFYINDIIASANQDQVWYTITYIIISLIFDVLYILYIFITDASSKCVCKCFRQSEYDKLIAETLYN